MILLGYLSWNKTLNKEFRYGKKLRTYSKLIFFALPVLSFIIWFNFIRLTEECKIKRDKYIQLGDYYYDKEHLRSLASEPYRKAVEIDPSLAKIIKRIKKLEE